MCRAWAASVARGSVLGRAACRRARGRPRAAPHRATGQREGCRPRASASGCRARRRSRDRRASLGTSNRGVCTRRAATSRLLLLRGQETRKDGGRALPVACFLLELFTSSSGEAIELCLPVVCGKAPLGRDVAFLLELEQGGIERAVVHDEMIRAGLLDATGNAVAVERPERLERLEHH